VHVCDGDNCSYQVRGFPPTSHPNSAGVIDNGKFRLAGPPPRLGPPSPLQPAQLIDTPVITSLEDDLEHVGRHVHEQRPLRLSLSRRHPAECIPMMMPQLPSGSLTKLRLYFASNTDGSYPADAQPFSTSSKLGPMFTPLPLFPKVPIDTQSWRIGDTTVIIVASGISQDVDSSFPTAQQPVPSISFLHGPSLGSYTQPDTTPQLWYSQPRLHR